VHHRVFLRAVLARRVVEPEVAVAAPAGAERPGGIRIAFDRVTASSYHSDGALFGLRNAMDAAAVGPLGVAHGRLTPASSVLG